MRRCYPCLGRFPQKWSFGINLFHRVNHIQLFHMCRNHTWQRMLQAFESGSLSLHVIATFRQFSGHGLFHGIVHSKPSIWGIPMYGNPHMMVSMTAPNAKPPARVPAALAIPEPALAAELPLLRVLRTPWQRSNARATHGNPWGPHDWDVGVPKATPKSTQSSSGSNAKKS